MGMEFFTQRERELLGDRFESLYAYPEDTPARGITPNLLRAQAESALDQAFPGLLKNPFNEKCRLLTGEQERPGIHPYHHAGVYYVQEPSAASVAPLLEVEPGMKVLDLCAAPGGKTSQLAGALQGKGLLVANEYMSQRAEILKQNLERMGVPNALILNEETSRIAAQFPGYFDRVLVDAPCSGEGMFRKEPQAMAQHNQGLVDQCAGLGKEILEAAAACLAPGGILVYSTCTFSPQEDESQIAAFLDRHPEFSLMELPGDWGSAGESNRTGGLPLDCSKVRRIWPCQGGEGHFMAKLKKEEGSRWEDARSQKKKAEKQVSLWEEFAARYFPGLKDSQTQLLGNLVLLPPVGLPPVGKLHIVRSGVAAGQIIKGRFQPNHHLFMAFGDKCTNRENLALGEDRLYAWLRGEEIPASQAENGWCAVLVDGYPLGMGKVSGGRIKNHYPKALRNLK